MIRLQDQKTGQTFAVDGDNVTLGAIPTRLLRSIMIEQGQGGTAESYLRKYVAALSNQLSVRNSTGIIVLEATEEPEEPDA